VRVIILATKQATAAGTELRVVAQSRSVRRVIEVAGTQDYLHLSGDRASARTDCCPVSRQARS
jgi:anti-anti-sigma regulatory factor